MGRTVSGSGLPGACCSSEETLGQFSSSSAKAGAWEDSCGAVGRSNSLYLTDLPMAERKLER